MSFVEKYAIVLNGFTFVLFALDKLLAVLDLWRIRERTLLLFAWLGGSLGALVAMGLTRHKINRDLHPGFAYGVPIALGVHLAVFLLLKWILK